MRVRDLQEFLSTFTASNKSGTRQGNAVSDAVIYVEIRGQLQPLAVEGQTMSRNLEFGFGSYLG